MVFFERYQLVVMPVSWQRPFPVDEDQKGDAAMAALLRAQVPILACSTLGLPGLAVPGDARRRRAGGRAARRPALWRGNAVCRRRSDRGEDGGEDADRSASVK